MLSVSFPFHAAAARTASNATCGTLSKRRAPYRFYKFSEAQHREQAGTVPHVSKPQHAHDSTHFQTPTLLRFYTFLIPFSNLRTRVSEPQDPLQAGTFRARCHTRRNPSTDARMHTSPRTRSGPGSSSSHARWPPFPSSLITPPPPVGPYSSPLPMDLW